MSSALYKMPLGINLNPNYSVHNGHGDLYAYLSRVHVCRWTHLLARHF